MYRTLSPSPTLHPYCSLTSDKITPIGIQRCEICKQGCVKIACLNLKWWHYRAHPTERTRAGGFEQRTKLGWREMMGCMSLTDVRQKVKLFSAILPLPSLLRNSPSNEKALIRSLGGRWAWSEEHACRWWTASITRRDEMEANPRQTTPPYLISHLGGFCHLHLSYKLIHVNPVYIPHSTFLFRSQQYETKTTASQVGYSAVPIYCANPMTNVKRHMLVTLTMCPGSAEGLCTWTRCPQHTALFVFIVADSLC